MRQWSLIDVPYPDTHIPNSGGMMDGVVVVVVVVIWCIVRSKVTHKMLELI